MKQSMTVTEELRELLSERGVEWWSQRFPNDDDSTTVTYWNGFVEGEPWGVWELMDLGGRLFIEFNNDRDFPITPEQVIAATLGPGTCKEVRIRMEIEDEMHCSECGCFLGFAGDVSAPPYNYCPNCGCMVSKDESCCPDCNTRMVDE